MLDLESQAIHKVNFKWHFSNQFFCGNNDLAAFFKKKTYPLKSSNSRLAKDETIAATDASVIPDPRTKDSIRSPLIKQIFLLKPCRNTLDCTLQCHMNYLLLKESTNLVPQVSTC